MSKSRHKNGVLSAYYGTLQQLITLIFGLIGLGIVSYIIMQKQLNKIAITFEEN